MQTQISLLKTLVYADIFAYPLKENELWRYFVGKKISLVKFRQSIKMLCETKKIGERDGYYFIKSHQQFIEIRKKREKFAIAKLAIAKRAARLLSIIPTIYFIGVSGALAVSNAPVHDDIDFFIITAPHTLWTTRFLATALLDVFNLRRKPGQTSFKNKICLNMFMDAAKLVLPRAQRDLYSAHEIVQLKYVVNKNLTYEQFLKANSWVHRLLPQAISTPRVKHPSFRQKFYWLHKFERIIKFLQIRYMQKKRTTEKINSYLLRFHPQDMRAIVNEEYKQRLRKILV